MAFYVASRLRQRRERLAKEGKGSNGKAMLH